MASTSGGRREGSAKRHVLLFGSSFDPPTGSGGHGGIVAALREFHPDSEVWLLPVYRHAFAEKRGRVQGGSSFASRIEMLRLQFEDHGGRVKVCLAEKELSDSREKQGLEGDALLFGTMDVIDYLQSLHPDVRFTFVLGGDTFLDLIKGKWRRTEDLLSRVPLVVIPRPGVFFDDASIDFSIFKAGIEVRTIPWLGQVSSKLVRSILSSSHSDPRLTPELINEHVLNYIRNHKLYSTL